MSILLLKYVLFPIACDIFFVLILNKEVKNPRWLSSAYII